MLYILFHTAYTEEEAAKVTGRKLVTHTDAEFSVATRELDLNEDELFLNCVKEIDTCDVPFPNVIRDLYTGNTHSFDRVSSGAKAMWLLGRLHEKFIMPSAFFGPNCYKILVELSKDRDIYIYEDAHMFGYPESDELEGVFTDFKTKQVVELGGYTAFDYICDMGY